MLVLSGRAGLTTASCVCVRLFRHAACAPLAAELEEAAAMLTEGEALTVAVTTQAVPTTA